MADLNTIINGEQAHLVFQGVRDYIFDTKCGHLEPYESYSKRLSEGERFVIFAHCFIAEVANGGLSQFLSNSSGDLAGDTRTAMRQIGATAAADALDDVRTTIFGGSPIPTDRGVRCDIVFEWEEQDEERSRAFYAKHELGWCEPVELAIARYIKAHREMFT